MSVPKPVVVISNKVFDETLDLLATRCDVVPNPSVEPLEPQHLKERCKEADALMAFMPDSIDNDFLDACPRLQVIGCALKGYDNFDIDACSAHGVWVSIVSDLLTEPTAELAVGLMIGIGRQLLTGDDIVRNGFAGWQPVLYGTGLSGSRVGIVGMGKVGQAIAARLSGFGAQLIYSDPAPLDRSREDTLNLERVSLDAIAKHSDFVVIATPLVPETTGLIDNAFLRRTKPSAFIVNPARGSVVDEIAVADALAAGTLGGYAADTFAFEDWSLPGRLREIPPRLLANRAKTLFTPHIGSAVVSVRREIEYDAAKNILEALSGKRPHGAINRIDPGDETAVAN